MANYKSVQDNGLALLLAASGGITINTGCSDNYRSTLQVHHPGEALTGTRISFSIAL